MSSFELREKTLGQILDETIAAYPDNDAVVYVDRDYRQTYKEFGKVVDDLAQGLMALGVKKGEKVAVWATNVPYWVALQFATAKIGAVLLTVNTNYRKSELEYLLSQSECESLFIMDGYRDHDFIQTIYDIIPELRQQPRGKLSVDKLPALKRVMFLGVEKHRGMYSIPEIMAMKAMVTEEEYRARQETLSPYDVVNSSTLPVLQGSLKGLCLPT